MTKMPETIYAYWVEESGTVAANISGGIKHPKEERPTPYRRIDDDTLVLSRKELEGMRKEDALYCADGGLLRQRQGEVKGHNAAIDEILKK